MPAIAPPAEYDGTPVRRVVPAWTRMFRVHKVHREVEAFSPKPADPHFGGGRFDSVEGDQDPYPYLYGAFTEHTAVAEVFLRNLRFTDSGVRHLLGEQVRQRRLSAFVPTRDLTLVSLTTGPELAAIGQDAWLIHAEADEYARTRRWAAWLHGKAATWADGLVWPSKRDVGAEALILFGDRLGAGALKAVADAPPPLDLDGEQGWRWLDRELARYRVVVRRPVPAE